LGNKSKAKGTRVETAVVRHLQAHGIEAERLALHGSKDCGDVRVKAASPFVLEIKAGKQTANYNRSDKKIWLAQTRAEQMNSGMPCWLLIARYQRKHDDWEVWSSDGRRFFYFDEFIDILTIDTL